MPARRRRVPRDRADAISSRWPRPGARCGPNSSRKIVPFVVEPFGATRVCPGLRGRMNSVETFAAKAKTGIWGLDDILAGGFSRGHLFLVEGAPGHRQDHGRAAIPARRRQGRREVPLHHAVGDRARAARGGGVAWLGAGRRHRGVRAVAAGKPARFRAAAEPALFVRSRTRRNHQADFRGGRARQAEPGGAGQPLRNPAAGAKLAALPAADPGDSSIISPSSTPP